MFADIQLGFKIHEFEAFKNLITVCSVVGSVRIKQICEKPNLYIKRKKGWKIKNKIILLFFLVKWISGSEIWIKHSVGIRIYQKKIKFGMKIELFLVCYPTNS